MTMSGSGGEILLISHNTSQVRSLMTGTIVGKGELSKDEVSWEKDLELTYWKTC
jgi:hypothetical protein